jgi:AcrR family transcriptional regulator
MNSTLRQPSITPRLNLKRKLADPRPRRGAPASPPERLVAAAAKVFNTAGYHGTDSNRIAAEAGYSPGTFYKHFADKQEIFLAAYEAWVGSEWAAVDEELSTRASAEVVARRLVQLTVDFHTRWSGFRTSLLALVQQDVEVKRFYLDQRRRQLDLMAKIRFDRGTRAHEREEDAIHLFTMERSCDAIARGELRSLGLDREAMMRVLAARVVEALR